VLGTRWIRLAIAKKRTPRRALFAVAAVVEVVGLVVASSQLVSRPLLVATQRAPHPAPSSAAYEATVDPWGVPEAILRAPLPTAKVAPPRPVRFLLVRIPRDLPITSRPGGGEKVGVLPSRSLLGHPMIVWVMQTHTHGRYGRVTVPWSVEHAKGWISLAGLRPRWTKVSLVVDRSRHLMRVKRGDTTIYRFKVATGRPGLPTPLGRFYVTDRLVMGPAYGGFAFALSTVQVLPSEGLITGLVAIHGTNDPGSIGFPVSHGCIRVPAWALGMLKGLLVAGTPVVVEP
jgi:hypothetical protein